MNIKKTALVGIDVSYKTFNAFHSGTDCEYKNTRAGWQKLVKEAPPNSTYAMEATGYYHYRLASFLRSKNCRVIVLNPYYIKHWIIAQGSKAKTDKINARDIFAYALSENSNAREWESPSPQYNRARVIVTLLSGLAKLRGSANNINHAVSLVVGKGSDSLSTMSSLASYCREQEKALETELAEIAQRLYPEQYRLLRTIPSLGAKTASVLLVVCKGFADFVNYRQLTSFVGLASKVEESGTSVKKKQHITKTGNNYLRSLLFMCSMTALNLCSPCKDLYSRLVARGKPKKLALIAVMHRLVKISFGVVNSGEPYFGNRAVLA